MNKREQIRSEIYYRELDIDRSAADSAARTIPASLSSEFPVPRWFGKEILVHSAEAVDLSRAADGLPMLFGHDTAAPIGLARNVRIEGDKLRADLHFSNNSRAQEVYRDVADGFLRNISIGYRVREWLERDDSDEVRITEWELLEASVVTVPADSTVGINRSASPTQEGNTMNDTTKPATGGNGTPASGVNVVDFNDARRAAHAEGEAAGRKLELSRVNDIEGLFEPVRYQSSDCQALKRELIKTGASIEAARDALLRHLGDGFTPTRAGNSDTDRAPRISIAQADTDKMERGVELALSARAGVKLTAEERREAQSGPYMAYSMVDLAREFNRLEGVDMSGLNRRDLVGRSFFRSGIVGHTTSSFANVLANVANKSLLQGWTDAPETWQIWCRIGSISDFKQSSRVGISEFSDLTVVPEGAEFKQGTVSDRKEMITLATYGKMFSISRQAIINDDLSALGDIPRRMGRAAARIPGDLAYGVLTTNAALNQDSTALFHANHSNLVAHGSGAGPSVATVSAARVAMAKQTDPSGNQVLNIRPAFWIGPIALETTAKVLFAAQYDPAGTAGTLTPNPVAGMCTVVADARLDTADPVAWYMAAGIGDTVEVAFLDGQTTPYLEMKDGWSVDGVEHKVRLDCAAAALDFRGLYNNNGN